MTAHCAPTRHKETAMNELISLSRANQEKAHAIIEATGIRDIWKRFGARARLVGSLRTGLLMDKRDIDFHIYSDEFVLADSFAAIAALAENSRIQRIEYANLLDTEEHCLEWHAWYRDRDDVLWQLDMIHILKDSQFAGYFEDVADRIKGTLTDETREAILRIKHELPADVHVMSIAIYKAVIAHGVRGTDEFLQWHKANPADGIVAWMP